MKKYTRLISLTLTFLMIFSMVPITDSFAADLGKLEATSGLDGKVIVNWTLVHSGWEWRDDEIKIGYREKGKTAFMESVQDNDDEAIITGLTNGVTYEFALLENLENSFDGYNDLIAEATPNKFVGVNFVSNGDQGSTA